MKKAIKYFFYFVIVIVIIFIIIGIGDESVGTGSGSDTVQTEQGLSKPAVEILQHTAKYESVMSTYTVHCRVKNNTKKLITYVDLQATFYNDAGTIVGTGMGNSTNLAAGAERTIDVVAMDIEDAAKYDVEVDQIVYQ